MHTFNTKISQEHIDFEKEEISKNLFCMLLDEVRGAEEYFDNYEMAKSIGNQSLSAMFLKHAHDEILHFDDIVKQIDIMIGDINQNPLKPLYINIKEWRDSIFEDLSSQR